MVSYYGYEMRRHKLQAVKPCLSENACSFKFFKIKRLVDELVQSNPLCVILHVKRKKVLILPVFTWFLIIDKIQDGHQDGDHVWWRHRPPAAPPPMNIAHLVEKVKGFPLKAKSFRNIATYQKPKGGGGSIDPPPPCTTVGVWLCVYARGLKQLRWLVKTRHVHQIVPKWLKLTWYNSMLWLWRWLPHRLQNSRFFS